VLLATINARNPVLGVWSRRGRESGVWQIEALPESRHCGWDVEPLACQGIDQVTPSAGGVQLDDCDLVELVLHRVQSPSPDQQAVAISEQGAA
jgi:hypothetical protein